MNGFSNIFSNHFQGIYVTEVHESSASAKAGLRIHDKILQCNGYDFTMVSLGACVN